MNKELTSQAFLRDVLPTLARHMKHNPDQVAYAASVDKAYRAGTDTISFIQGDTGIGKSIAYLCCAAEWLGNASPQRPRRVVVSTFTRALQRQLADDDTVGIVNEYRKHAGLRPLTIGVVMGRMNYVSVDRVATLLALRHSGQRLAEIAEDEAMPRADRQLATWVLANPEGCLLDYPEDALPSDLTFKDICLTKDEQMSPELAAHLQAGKVADVVVVNHSLMITSLIGSGNGVFADDAKILNIVDEGEHFPEVAADVLSYGFSFGSVSRLAKSLGYTRHQQRWERLEQAYSMPSMSDQARSLEPAERDELAEACLRLSQSRTVDASLSDAHALWNDRRDEARRLRAMLSRGDESTALIYSPIEGRPRLSYIDNDAGRVIQKGMSGRITIFTSATLSDMNAKESQDTFYSIQRALRLKYDDSRVGVEAIHEPVRFGELSLVNRAIAGLPFNSKAGQSRASLRREYIDNIVEAVREPTSGRTLVLCASYSDQRAIVERIPSGLYSRVSAPGPGHDLNTLSEALPENGILITPAGWEGLSPRRQDSAFWSRLVLVRNPNAPISPSALHAETMYRQRMGYKPLEARKMASSKLQIAMRTRTLQKIRQGIGRGVRHPDDQCEIVVLDPRLINQRDASKSALVGLLPRRFQKQARGLSGRTSLKVHTAPKITI